MVAPVAVAVVPPHYGIRPFSSSCDRGVVQVLHQQYTVHAQKVLRCEHQGLRLVAFEQRPHEVAGVPQEPLRQKEGAQGFCALVAVVFEQLRDLGHHPAQYTAETEAEAHKVSCTAEAGAGGGREDISSVAEARRMRV